MSVKILCAMDKEAEKISVPGSEKEECGNYKSHDLETAQYWLKKYKFILEECYG